MRWRHSRRSKGAFRQEVDFALWCQDREPLAGPVRKTSLVFGEAKSFATTGFKTEDVDRMRGLGNKFPGSFAAFATLKDALSPVERTRIAALAGHMPIIVLTAAELFSQTRLARAWREKGGKWAELQNRIKSLEDLAQATQALYLR